MEPYKAPPFPEDVKWLNIDSPLSLEKLDGQIVVLDFWTYCCINCMHVLPDLEYLEEKYKDEPVVFIGVHSPKFENEKSEEMVKAAIARYGITHPVLMDNNHETWKSYNVQAWPTLAVLNEDGIVAYQGSGEGHLGTLIEYIDVLLKQGKERKALAKPLGLKPTISKSKNELSFPSKINLHEGQLTIVDSNNHRILVCELQGKKAKVLHAIGGNRGLKDGTFATAHFNQPHGVTRVGDTLYVADTKNHAIRKIDLTTKEVTTILGNGKQVNGMPTKDSLNSPWDVLVHEDELFIAMAGSHQIWTYDLSKETFHLFAGTGREDIIDGDYTEAAFAQPSGLSTDGEYLYVVDSETSSIRKVHLSSRQVDTMVGRGLFEFGHQDGFFQDASLQHPIGVHVSEGKVFVADTYNHAIRVLQDKLGIVGTLLQRNAGVCTPDGKCTDKTDLFEPNDVVFDKGRLFIADTNNHAIKVVESGSLFELELEF